MSTNGLIAIILLYICTHILIKRIRIHIIKRLIKDNTSLSDITILDRVWGSEERDLYNNIIKGSIMPNTVESRMKDMYRVHVINFRLNNCRGQIYRLQTKYGKPIYYFTQYDLWIRGRRNNSVKYLDKVLNSYTEGITDFSKNSNKVNDLFINK